MNNPNEGNTMAQTPYTVHELRRQLSRSKTELAKYEIKSAEKIKAYKHKMDRLETEIAELDGEAEHQHQLKLIQIIVKAENTLREQETA